MISLLAYLALATAIGPVIGDFDGDGHRDVARLIHQSDGHVAIAIDRSGHQRAIVDRQMLSDPFLTRNSYRGTVRTACGKGYRGHCGGVPKVIVLRGGEPIYGQYESTSFVVIWTGRRFRSIRLSD